MSKKKISLIVNIVLLILELIGFAYVATENGISSLRYYTQDSNIVVIIAAVLYIIYYFKSEKEGKEELPYFVGLIKYIASCVVTVTFIVVLTVLAPSRASEGRDAVIHVIVGGSNLYHHVLCPILCVISNIFIDEKITISLKENLLATIPTFLYGTITLILNIAKVMYGPYIFLHVYEQSVLMSVFWFMAIVGGGFLIAFLFGILINKHIK